MVFRRTASSSEISNLSLPQTKSSEEEKGRFRSSSVSKQQGISYLSGSPQLQVLSTALSERTVKHVTTVKACVSLARLLAGVSNKARSFVVSRSQDLVHTLLQRNDLQASHTAHQLIDKLARHQKEQSEELADWRCNAYGQLGQQYAEANDTESLTRSTESMEKELKKCSSSHSRLVRISLANAYQTIAEQYMGQKTQVSNEKAAQYIANITRFSSDPKIMEWQIQRATDLLKPVNNTSTPAVRKFAIQFMKALEDNAGEHHEIRLFLQPYKTYIAPTVFATEHLSAYKPVQLLADRSIAPRKVVIYGRNSHQMTDRIETIYQTTGKVQSSDNSYKDISFHSGFTTAVMASEPVSQKEASLVAQQQLNKRSGAGDITSLPSSGTDYTMSQLGPDQADRILFYTDIHTPCTQSEQWQKDLQNFAVILNCEPDDKLTRWKRVRFLINSDGMTNPSDIRLRRQGIMADVNKLLKPMGLTMDESHFVMTAGNPDELPEAYQQDLQGQFLPAIPEPNS